MESFSLLNLINSIKDWFTFLLSNLKGIFIITSIFLSLVLLFNFIKSPVHYARTSFVLDSESSSNSIGDIASLASLAGINASSFIDASSLFQIDNIQELYRSNSMIKQTLLTDSDFGNERSLLIDRLASNEKIDKKWDKLNVDFSTYNSKSNNLRVHDSILNEVVKIIKEKYLLVDKPSRKTTILEIGFDHKDELFAKSFNENLVSIVNDFYFKTKTQKTGENLKILERQADSVKKVLDKSILLLAEKDQSIPNPNPLTKVSLVPYQKALVDVQANGAIYQQIVTQLELAKVTHRNNTPLIQIIDKPVLPLENSRLKLFECFVYGIFGGLFFSVLYYSFLRFYKSLIK
ncbi:MAG: exopolysaccharide biosynthesis protein [Candidatus Marinimicrobia bacterium]|nr:exopolysaccharide biosynthesis protein [Candidatus Neomarinimicrobiota bacterium]